MVSPKDTPLYVIGTHFQKMGARYLSQDSRDCPATAAVLRQDQVSQDRGVSRDSQEVSPDRGVS